MHIGYKKAGFKTDNRYLYREGNRKDQVEDQVHGEIYPAHSSFMLNNLKKRNISKAEERGRRSIVRRVGDVKKWKHRSWGSVPGRKLTCRGSLEL